MNGKGDQMPTKKKAGKGEEPARNSSAGKDEATAAPVEAGQASVAGSTRATNASKKTRGKTAAKAKPRPKREATAKASKSSERRREDPVSAILSDAPPTHAQIAARAYELFAASGYQDGHSEEHWLQAERELQREYAAKRQSPSKPSPTFSSV